MQHGSADTVGLINTGDLVIAEKISPSQIVPYVVGTQTGYRTYGEFGDVILYHPNGSASDAPIIHRAIVYIVVSPNGTYSIPELQGLSCGFTKNAVYNATAEPGGCGATNLVGGELILYNIGWMGATVHIALSPSTLGTHSGYITMGDNNFVPEKPPEGLPDEPSLTPLVQPGWIIGVARGMIPWFGSVKLLLDGNAGAVPTGSWEFMGLTIIGFLLAAFGIHYALRAEGIEDERRRELEDEEEALEEERPAHWWRLRRARDDGEEEDEEEEESKGPRKGTPHEDGRTLLQRLQPRNWGSSDRSGGRPPPAVKRGKGKSRRGRTDADDEDEL
jgi:signal peptidase